MEIWGMIYIQQDRMELLASMRRVKTLCAISHLKKVTFNKLRSRIAGQPFSESDETIFVPANDR